MSVLHFPCLLFAYCFLPVAFACYASPVAATYCFCLLLSPVPSVLKQRSALTCVSKQLLHHRQVGELLGALPVAHDFGG